MPGAKTAVCDAHELFPWRRGPNPSPESRESLSTRGRPNYHDVLGNRLEQLAIAIRELVPGATTRCYVDAGPVPERELAQLAGSDGSART